MNAADEETVLVYLDDLSKRLAKAVNRLEEAHPNPTEEEDDDDPR